MDDRIACVVGVACLTRYENLIRHGQLKQHGVLAALGKPAELVALTLDGMSENGAPPPGGVPGPVAPVSKIGRAHV